MSTGRKYVQHCSADALLLNGIIVLSVLCGVTFMQMGLLNVIQVTK